MSNISGIGGESRPQSYTAARIQSTLLEIEKELQSCINSFERVFGMGQSKLKETEGKKQAEQDLPFVRLNNLIDRILADLRHLAGRMDSEL